MNEPNHEARAANRKIVEDCISKLSEHFENVQIFVSNLESGGDHTHSVQLGTGNWFARYGQAKSWCIQVEEQERIRIRKDYNDDNPS